jgi:hypothetical protein
MRLACVVVCALLIPNSPPFSSSKQITVGPPVQAPALLQSALSALTGGHSISDVTLTAAANIMAGSDDEAGTATLKAVLVGASSVNLSLSLGQRSEIMNTSVTPATGTWSGPDGVVHPMAFHNLLTGSSWFFPAFALAASSSASGALVIYIGHETHNGQAVEHLTISEPSPVTFAPGAPSYAHLTQLDFFVDSSTFLPAALDFNIHPDDNELVDIPVEIQFTNYTTVKGIQIPFHIQKFINNTLTLDLQIQSATINSGLSVSSFVAQ